MKINLLDADSIINIVTCKYTIPKDILEMVQEVDDLDARDEAIQALYKEFSNVDAVKAHVDQFVNDIINATGCSHYLGFLGNRHRSITFRHHLAVTKPYKGNRSKSPHYIKFWKPIVVEHLVKEWNFIELSNLEADDAVAICASYFKDTVICSPDKDLKQLPGNHYDYKKQEFDTVTYDQSIRNLYTQCLVGDSTDNIAGCKGVGKKSPFLSFEGCNKPEDFHKFAYEVYKTKGQESLMAEMLSLVYMLRNLDGIDLKEYPKPNVKREIGTTDSVQFQGSAGVADPSMVAPTVNFGQ